MRIDDSATGESPSSAARTASLRVLVYADFRSSHATEWARGLREAGIDVVEVSSEATDAHASPGVVSRMRTRILRPRSPFAYRLRAHLGNGTKFQIVHTVLALLRLPARRKILSRAIEDTRPNLIHALRLPYEGLTALSCARDTPLVVSTWGQDFHPQAENDLLLRTWLRRVLPRADGLHVDERADFDRAFAYGFSRDAPTLFAAGNFGVEPNLFHPGPKRDLVVFPRRATPVSNYSVFLEAVKELQDVDAEFVGIGLSASPDALRSRDFHRRLVLTEDLPREEYASILRAARVVVSLNDVDGTANSILEALACGARVVVGSLAQYEAMARTGVPVDLVPRDDPKAVALAIRRALDEHDQTAVAVQLEFNREHNARAIVPFFEAVMAAHEARR